MDKYIVINVIKNVMPKEAEIIDSNITSGYDFHVSWLQNDDANRPNKRSKTIVISISRETISDMESLNKEQLEGVAERLKNKMTNTLNQYDSSNNNPREMEPEVDRWIFKYEDLVG